MKIWIVYAKFGHGHYSVAEALKEEMESLGHEVIIDDIIEVVYPSIYRAVYYSFNNVICRNVKLYNCINDIGRNKKNKIVHSKKINNRINEVNPDMIITTWSACARIIGSVNVPTYTCITDVGVHDGWINDNVSGYFVASKEVKDSLINKGINEEDICIYGIPVKRNFKETKRNNIHGKNVLIMGGGLGLISWIDDVLIELSKYSNIKVTVITGRNPKLYKKLDNEYPNVNVVGFTNKVHKFMANSDLIISKPGGVSLFESIYSETPYIAVAPKFKHEISNAEFILNRNMGQVYFEGQSFGRSIANLLNDNDTLEQFHKNICNIKEEIETGRYNNFILEGVI